MGVDFLALSTGQMEYCSYAGTLSPDRQKWFLTLQLGELLGTL